MSNEHGNLGGFYKPPAELIPFERPKKKPVIQKNRKKKNKFEKIRNTLIYKYGLGKYATNHALCYVIHKKTGIDMPANKTEYKKYLIAEYHRIKGTEGRKRIKTSNDFYKSAAWKELRYIALANSEGCCNLCGARARDGIVLHVDHIIPRSVNPEKELDLENLQVMCDDCNIGKSNYDDINWRKHWESI